MMMKKLLLMYVISAQVISLNASTELILTGKNYKKSSLTEKNYKEAFKTLPLSVQRELRPYFTQEEKIKSEQTSSSSSTSENLAEKVKESSFTDRYMCPYKLGSIIEEALVYPLRNEGLNRLRKYVLGKDSLSEMGRNSLLHEHINIWGLWQRLPIKYVLQTLDHRLFPQIHEIVQLVLPGLDLTQDHTKSIEETVVHYFEQVLFYDMRYEVIESIFSRCPIDVNCEDFILNRPIDRKDLDGSIREVKKYPLNYCIDCSDEDFFKLFDYEPFYYGKNFLESLREGKVPLETRIRFENRNKMRRLVAKNRHGSRLTELPEAVKETGASSGASEGNSAENSSSVKIFDSSDFICLILDCLYERRPLTDLMTFVTIQRMDLLAKFKTITIGDKTIRHYLRGKDIRQKKRTEVKAILNPFIVDYDLQQNDFVRLLLDCLDSKRPITDLVSFIRIHRTDLLINFKTLKIGKQTLSEYLRLHSESKEKGGEVMAALDLFLCDENLLSRDDSLFRLMSPSRASFPYPGRFRPYE